jgi:hypothetical protein
MKFKEVFMYRTLIFLIFASFLMPLQAATVTRAGRVIDQPILPPNYTSPNYSNNPSNLYNPVSPNSPVSPTNSASQYNSPSTLNSNFYSGSSGSPLTPYSYYSTPSVNPNYSPYSSSNLRPSSNSAGLSNRMNSTNSGNFNNAGSYNNSGSTNGMPQSPYNSALPGSVIQRGQY